MAFSSSSLQVESSADASPARQTSSIAVAHSKPGMQYTRPYLPVYEHKHLNITSITTYNTFKDARV